MAGIPPGTKIERREDFQRQVRFYPEDIAKWQQDIKALFASGGSRLSTDLRVNLGGGTRWYRVDGMCFRDAAGKVVRWTGSGIDVTARKVAEEALRLSEERYALAMEVADEGHLDWNVRTDEIFASAQAKRVLDVPPDAEYRTRDDVMSRVPYHPDDGPQRRGGVARVSRRGAAWSTNSNTASCAATSPAGSAAAGRSFATRPGRRCA